ncbi:hypothetical protein ABH975_002351 [Bradyrhizobium ottawaense]
MTGRLGWEWASGLVTMVLALSVCAASPASAADDQAETIQQGQAWTNRISQGACSKLRDRRTDTPENIAECRRDQAAQPLCLSYQGFAFAWYDLAENPPSGVDQLAFQTNVINTLGSDRGTPPYYQSPQYRDMLRRLLSFTFSPARKKWRTSAQFSEYAYRLCIERRPI